MRRTWTCTGCGKRAPEEVPTCYLIQGGLLCIWCVDVDAIADIRTQLRMRLLRVRAERLQVQADRAARQRPCEPAPSPDHPPPSRQHRAGGP